MSAEDQSALDAFWAAAQTLAAVTERPGVEGDVPSTMPPAWSFGVTAAQAEELLALVLAGQKTATASALWDYDAEGGGLPVPGDLAIVLDGHGQPKALIRTVTVRVVPFNEVDEQHAHAEGEGDRSLTRWRETHRRFFSDHRSHERPFRDDLPVVLETFEVLVPVRDPFGRAILEPCQTPPNGDRLS